MNALEALLASDDSDDDSLLIHYVSSQSGPAERRSWMSFTCAEFRQLTRFEKNDLERLRIALHIPDVVRTTSRFVFDGNDALTMTLRRLSYPSRQAELGQIFGYSVPQISQCMETVISMVHSNWQHLLYFSESRFNEANLRRFATATATAGCPLERCVGYIDGTVRPMCKPSRNQRQVYNGHKRCHGIKFQSVITPDGIISHLSGPFNGNRHDAALLVDSGLANHLEQRLRDTDGSFCLYGDAAYTTTAQIVSPFKGAILSAEKQLFNTAMSQYRIAVEAGFGKIVQLFAFTDFKKNLKLYLQPIGKYYLTAAILTNCHTSLYGSTVSTMFQLTPPTLEAYLSEAP